MSTFSLLIRRLSALAFRHGGEFTKIVDQVKEYLPTLLKLRKMSDDERREAIVKTVKAVLETRYPEYAFYADLVIDFVVAEVRKQLEKRK